MMILDLRLILRGIYALSVFVHLTPSASSSLLLAAPSVSVSFRFRAEVCTPEESVVRREQVKAFKLKGIDIGIIAVFVRHY